MDVTSQTSNDRNFAQLMLTTSMYIKYLLKRDSEPRDRQLVNSVICADLFDSTMLLFDSAVTRRSFCTSTEFSLSLLAVNVRIKSKNDFGCRI